MNSQRLKTRAIDHSMYYCVYVTLSTAAAPAASDFPALFSKRPSSVGPSSPFARSAISIPRAFNAKLNCCTYTHGFRCRGDGFGAFIEIEKISIYNVLLLLLLLFVWSSSSSLLPDGDASCDSYALPENQ